MLRALMWKEWREHQDQITALTLLVTMPTYLFSLMLVWMTPNPGNALPIIGSVLSIIALTTAIFLAAKTVLSERVGGRRGTLTTLVALPAPPLMIFAVKLFWGTLTLNAPIGLATFIAGSLLIAPPAVLTLPQTGPLFFDTVYTSLYLWTVALGMRQTTELRVVLVGFFFAAGCYILGTVLASIWMSNGGTQASLNSAAFVWLQILWCLCPAIIACWRFDRLVHRRVGVGSPAANPETNRHARGLEPAWIFRGPHWALWWKVWRETRIMSVATLGIAATLGALAEGLVVRPMGPNTLERLTEASLISTFFLAWLGILLAVAIGTAVSCPDLQPKVVAFWHSRPIFPGRYFTTKYLFGLTILLLTTGAPWVLLCCAAMLGARNLEGITRNFEAATIVAMALSVQALVYTFSVLIGSLIRRPAIAGVVSTVAAVATCIIVGLELFYNSGSRDSSPFLIVLVWAIALTACSATLARAAWIRDWKFAWLTG